MFTKNTGANSAPQPKTTAIQGHHGHVIRSKIGVDEALRRTAPDDAQTAFVRSSPLQAAILCPREPKPVTPNQRKLSAQLSSRQRHPLTPRGCDTTTLALKRRYSLARPWQSAHPGRPYCQLLFESPSPPEGRAGGTHWISIRRRPKAVLHLDDGVVRSHGERRAASSPSLFSRL